MLGFEKMASKPPGSSPSSDPGIIKFFKALSNFIDDDPWGSFSPQEYTSKPECEFLRQFSEYTISATSERAVKILPQLVLLLKDFAENINKETYFRNMECLLYGFHHLACKVPSETIRLCGYEIVQSAVTPHEDFSKLYEEFTERLTRVNDRTREKIENLAEQMVEQDKSILRDKDLENEILLARKDTKTEMRACINILAMIKELQKKTPSFFGDTVVKLSWKQANQPPIASKTSIQEYRKRTPLRSAELDSLYARHRETFYSFGTCDLTEAEARSLVKDTSVVGKDKVPGKPLVLNDDGIVALLGWMTNEGKFATYLTEGVNSGVIRDQLFHYLCWAYVAADLVSCLRLQKGLEDSNIPLCTWYLCEFCEPEKLSFHVENHCPHMCQGSTIENGLRHIKEYGIPVEISEEFDCCDNNPPSADEPQMNSRRIKDVLRIDSLEEALDYLKRNGQPIGADLINCERLLRSKGYIYYGPVEHSSPFMGYHAVIIESVKEINGEHVAVCKMSNGNDCGFDGYAYVSLAVVYIPVGVNPQKHDMVIGSTRPVHLLTNFIVPVMDTEKDVVVDDDGDGDGDGGDDDGDDDRKEEDFEKEEEKPVKKQHLRPLKRPRTQRHPPQRGEDSGINKIPEVKLKTLLPRGQEENKA